MWFSQNHSVIPITLKNQMLTSHSNEAPLHLDPVYALNVFWFFLSLLLHFTPGTLTF